jgi:ribonucleoside-triphosphate reductase (formate)
MNFVDSSAAFSSTPTTKLSPQIQTGQTEKIKQRNSYQTTVKIYSPGMGEAVAKRTISRKLDPLTREELEPLPLGTVDDRPFDRETWEEVAFRVAAGNIEILRKYVYKDSANSIEKVILNREFHDMHHHLRQASLLMSGRHLQHGDLDQPNRPIEVFTNCATAPATFLKFYLLLNGSGVGRAYDDLMMKVDYSKMPVVVPVIDSTHRDVQSGEIRFSERRDAEHFYQGRNIIVHEVGDSREGWGKAIEQIERLAFEEQRETVLILDFSKVRPKGSPIKGMQNRPASGPAPLMVAIANMARLRDAGMAPWRSAMYADHYMADCVLVGGARRAARMATKTWRDKSVLDFIGVKVGNFLWSANNSVTVDNTFWRYVHKVRTAIDKYGDKKLESIEDIIDDLIEACRISDLEGHAYKVFDSVCRHAYYDGTGEPGFINQHKLTFNPEGIKQFQDGLFAESSRYKLDPETLKLTKSLAKAFVKSPYKTITNPCGEIVLTMIGGYCVIADVVPYHATTDDDAEDAFRVATRALIRTNLMEALYSREVLRTNRIGVGMTGIHEYAWSRFKYGWHDLIDEKKSKPFWLMLSRFKRAVKSEAERYSKELGVEVPHTDTTVKPAGTTSKLFMLTEGAHLPSMREYLRWVQFREDDPLIESYRKKGYPIRELTTYNNTIIVGFPTVPEICTLGMDNVVTASEATPEEQYKWVKLLEKYWITGVEEDGVTPLSESGNQVSYTLKYDRKVVSFDSFQKAILEGQTEIRCCSVMPMEDGSAYEYQPEQAVTRDQYERICMAIEDAEKEDVGLEHVDCATGACPVDFKH